MVEWKKLGEFATLQKTKNKKHLTENAYSITQAGLVPTKSFFKEKTNVTSSDTSGYYIVEKDWFVYSPSRIDVGSINYLRDEGPVIVSPIDVVFSINSSICIPSFLLEYFFTYNGKKDLLKKREGVEGMGRRNLPFDAIKGIQIPIPTLSEQQRIVGILDTFTSSIDNLKQQIAKRRKQYEFYRDQLLDLEEKKGVDIRTLKYVAKIMNGRDYKFLNKGKYPVYGTGGIMTYVDGYAYSGPSVLLPRKGSVEKIYYVTEPFWTVDTIYWTQIEEDKVLPKYLYYALSRINLRDLSYGGGVPSLSQEILYKIVFPLPPLSGQQRIVDILDHFEASVQNLEAQLSQREKQYEYYRNKLLTFD